MAVAFRLLYPVGTNKEQREWTTSEPLFDVPVCV